MKMNLLKFFLLDLILLIIHTIHAQKPCFVNERRGLLEVKSFLKSQLFFGSSVDYLLPSWVEDPESDCCRWERVRCNSTTGRVIELSLNDFNTKSLVWNITLFLSFKELRSLDLSNNNIDGWIENQDLITLEILEKLNLSYNYFLGSIPPFIGKLSSLKALYLSGNGLNGSLPISGLCELKRLEVLDISFNQFEGILPQCLNDLTSLRILDLHGNLFSGSISPYLISSPKSLRFIDFSDNDFEGSFLFSSIFNHSKFEVAILGSREKELQIDIEIRGWNPQFQLKALVLSHCNLKSAPTFLLNQHRLKVVDLSHNKLNGKFPSWLLENNSDLKFLNLRNNSFTGEFHLPQHPMRGMIDIDVSNNHIGGRLPKDLGMVLSNLKYLTLSKNNFEGDLPTSIGRMRKLVILDLSLNNFSGKVPKELGKNCTHLRTLMLSGNKFHGEIFSTHFNLTNLVFLSLRDNQFTGSLTNLEFKFLFLFDISNNNMAGKIPSWAANLTVLAMRTNHFEGQLPCKQLFKGSFIDLSYNSLSGPLPSCLWTRDIEQIHLQGNNFTGSIPYAFNTSGFLSVLNLRDNSLSGQIHAQIGAHSDLTILLLGENLLSGLIPRQLCELPGLRIMDLSNNLFFGSIPSCLTNFTLRTFSDISVIFDFTKLKYFYSRGSYSLDEFLSFFEIQGEYDFYEEINEEYMIYHEGRSIPIPTVAEGALRPLVEVEIDFVTKSNLLSYKNDILNYMSGIDLSCNNLTGEIPEILGKLSSIRALNFSHNHLTGSIPASFSNLSKVESLDLSYNSLSGKIPLELVNLNFLEVFSVSHNNLSGRIPDKGQFATFGSSSYEGNPFLSGLPSEKNRTLVGETPSDNEIKERWYEIDPTFFFASFTATYFVFLLGFGAVLYINPYWRRRWFNFIENFLYSTYYFVVDTLHKLSTTVNN